METVGGGLSGYSVVWDGLTLGAGVTDPPVHRDPYSTGEGWEGERDHCQSAFL